MSKPKFVAAQSYPSTAIRVACERIAAGEDAEAVAEDYGWDSDVFEPLMETIEVEKKVAISLQKRIIEMQMADAEKEGKV